MMMMMMDNRFVLILWLFSISFVINSFPSPSPSSSSILYLEQLYENFVDENFHRMNINHNFSEKIANLIRNFYQNNDHQHDLRILMKTKNIAWLEKQFQRLSSQVCFVVVVAVVVKKNLINNLKFFFILNF